MHKNTKVKTRRGGESISGQKLKVISTNSQGDKFVCLAGLVQSKSAGVFTVQETKSRKKGKHSLQHYMIFESIRKKPGGGSLMGVHESLEPLLISCYEDQFELLVVETKIGQEEVRFITGYGPQESWEEGLKIPFFVALDQEIVKAQIAGKSVYISMDANSKLGTEYIPGDNHKMSKNGEILAEIIEKNALVVANGLRGKFEGIVTRQRTTEDGHVEKSTIDFVLVSHDLKDSIEKVKVDEERINVLTKVTKNKHGVLKKTQADHNIIETDLNIKWKRKDIKDKIEMYNLKNEQCQRKFKDYTNKTNMSEIFDSDKDINILTKKFLKRLDGCISQCFQKNRTTKSGKM